MKLLIITILCTFSFFNAACQVDAQKAFSEGVKLYKEQKYAEAEKHFSEAISKGETKSGLKMSHIYKALSLNGQKKYDEAIKFFDKAIEIDSLDQATYADRGKTFSYMRKYDKAISDFNKVLQIDSTGRQAEGSYYFLGRIKMLEGNNKDAIRYFDLLLLRVPNDSEGYFLRGTAKSNLMEIDGSIADFDQAIKYNTSYMEAYANRGVQKINKIPTAERLGKKIDCFPDACSDLEKAKQMGDSSVEDMIFLYCKKCR